MPEEITIQKEAVKSPELNSAETNLEIGAETETDLEKQKEQHSDYAQKAEAGSGSDATIDVAHKEIQNEANQLRNFDAQKQVKVLCDLAFQKGIDYSIKVARALDNAFILDKLHDYLVKEFSKQIKKI